jgi:hypothetical protein
MHGKRNISEADRISSCLKRSPELAETDARQFFVEEKLTAHMLETH